MLSERENGRMKQNITRMKYHIAKCFVADTWAVYRFLGRITYPLKDLTEDKLRYPDSIEQSIRQMHCLSYIAVADPEGIQGPVFKFPMKMK